jgi:hypothetical protein
VDYCRIGNIEFITQPNEDHFWWTGPEMEDLALTPAMLTAKAKKRYILSGNKLYSSAEAAAGSPKMGNYRVSLKVERAGNVYSGFGTLNSHGCLNGWPRLRYKNIAGIFAGDYSKEKIINLLFTERTWFWK